SVFFLNPLLGGLLAQASSVLDGVDGDLAEMRGQKSRFGAFLNSVLDRFVDVAIIMGVARYSLELHSGDLVLPVALGALSGCLLFSYVAAKGEADLGSPLRSGYLATYVASRDVRLFLVMVFVLASRPLILLGLLAATTYASTLARLLQTVRQEMTGEGPVG
ncbi:MAG: CDP-alcohol phosphatidyltransferase family protein, partial [Candidatus Geothermarchaeales archaeon]